MEILNKFKTWMLAIVTLGGIWKIPFGQVAASLVAIPLVFVGRNLYAISPDVHYWVLIVGILFLIGVLSLVLASLSVDRRHEIAVNRVVGFMIALFGVPIQIRFLLVAFILFHILRAALPIMMRSYWSLKVSELPGVLGLMSTDIICGAASSLVMNVFVFLTR